MTRYRTTYQIDFDNQLIDEARNKAIEMAEIRKSTPPREDIFQKKSKKLCRESDLSRRAAEFTSLGERNSSIVPDIMETDDDTAVQQLICKEKAAVQRARAEAGKPPRTELMEKKLIKYDATAKGEPMDKMKLQDVQEYLKIIGKEDTYPSYLDMPKEFRKRKIPELHQVKLWWQP